VDEYQKQEAFQPLREAVGKFISAASIVHTKIVHLA
jgi:hypothetical protein